MPPNVPVRGAGPGAGPGNRPGARRSPESNHPTTHGPENRPGDWYDDEPSILGAIIYELQRFKRRMKARPGKILFLALVLTSLVLLRYSTKPKVYEAQIVLRVSQGSLNDERGSPLPNRALPDYIYNYVLTRERIEKRIILALDENGNQTGQFDADKFPALHKHWSSIRDVYDDFGVDAAVAEFRDPLDIDAFSNYFFFDSRYDSTPRSVHLSISYSASDPEFAYKIVSICADIVVNNEAAKRLREARFAAENARLALNRSEHLVSETKEQLNQAQYELIRGELLGDNQLMAEAQVAINYLTERLKTEELRLDVLQRQQQDLAFHLRLEEASMAILWEPAWEDRPLILPPPGPIRLTLLAIVCLCVFVPVCAIFFGTMDSRIHELEDVTRLDMPIVGHLPRFEGDHVGSLRHRGALAGRGLLARMGFIKNRRLRDNRVA